MQTTDESREAEQSYIVSPQIKTMRVPILRDPKRGQEVISYLKAGTMVTVFSRSELWLCIRLPEQRCGYIQVAMARPATQEEIQRIAKISTAGQATAVSTSQASQSSNIIRSTASGMTGSGRAKSPPFGLMVSLINLSLVLCVLASLASSVVEGACVDFIFCVTTNPFAPLVTPLIVCAVIALVVGIIVGIVAKRSPSE